MGNIKKPVLITALTPWERTIALLARQGLASAEIAARIKTTDNTIRVALSRIYSCGGV